MKKKIVRRGIKLVLIRGTGLLVESYYMRFTAMKNDVLTDKEKKYVFKCIKWLKEYIQWCEDRYEWWWLYPKSYFRAKVALRECETFIKDIKELEGETECC